MHSESCPCGAVSISDDVPSHVNGAVDAICITLLHIAFIPVLRILRDPENCLEWLQRFCIIWKVMDHLNFLST